MMLLCLRRGLFFFVFLFSQLGMSAFSEELDITATFRLAVDAAPSVLISKYAVDVAKADRDIARAKSLPQATIFGQWSENNIDYDSSVLSQFENQRYPGERYGIQAKQSVFNWEDWQEASMRSATLQEARRSLSATQSDLLAQITARYLGVLLADADLVHLSDELVSLEQQLAEASAFYDRRLLPVTQLLETQARSDAVRAAVIEAKGAAAIAREQLVQLIGIRDFKLADVNASTSLVPTVVDAEEGIRIAMERNPRLAAAEAALQAARFDVGRAKGSRLPEVALSVSSQYSDVGFDNLTSPPRTTESVQLSVNVPLLEGGAGMARVRKAWAGYYSRQTELDAVRREVEARVRGAWLNFETATERVMAARHALESAKVNLQAVRKSSSVGATRLTDVLVALANVTRAKRDMDAADYSRVQSWLEVELAVGQDPALVASSLGRTVHRPEIR